MQKAILLFVLIGALLLVPSFAGANQLEMFGFNSRAVGLANTYTAIAAGPEASFYNPAALIESKRIRALAGYSFSVPAVYLDRLERNGDGMRDSEEVRQARSPEAAQYINAGVSGGLYDRVFFGLAMQIPVDGAARQKIFDADQPYFLKYDTGVFGLTIIPAMAVQIAPNYALGAGARITMDALGTMYTSIPTADGDYYTSTMADSRLSAQAAPIFGFYARTHEFLRFALTYHGQSYSYFHKTVEEHIVPSDPDGFVAIEYEARYNFIPRRITFAVAGEPDEHVLLTAEVSWVNWSSYKPPFPSINLDFSQMNEAGIPYERPDTLEVDDPDMNDTFVPRFGIEVRPYKYFTFQLGYALEPTPTGSQNGTTNIMDATTNVIALGIGSNFGGPSGDLVSVNLAIMDHMMTKRWASKDDGEMEEADPTTNPVYPRYESSGHFIYSALTASFRF